MPVDDEPTKTAATEAAAKEAVATDAATVEDTEDISRRTKSSEVVFATTYKAPNSAVAAKANPPH